LEQTITLIALDSKSKDQIKKKVELFNDFVRKDGGNLILKEIDRDNNVHLELNGACLDCPVDKEGIRISIEESIKKTYPSVPHVYLKPGTHPKRD